MVQHLSIVLSLPLSRSTVKIFLRLTAITINCKNPVGQHTHTHTPTHTLNIPMCIYRYYANVCEVDLGFVLGYFAYMWETIWFDWSINLWEFTTFWKSNYEQLYVCIDEYIDNMFACKLIIYSKRVFNALRVWQTCVYYRFIDAESEITTLLRHFFVVHNLSIVSK